jgi:hypothetical protein
VVSQRSSNSVEDLARMRIGILSRSQGELTGGGGRLSAFGI